MSLPEMEYVPKCVYVPIIEMKEYSIFLFIGDGWNDFGENERVLYYEIVKNMDGSLVSSHYDYFEAEEELKKIITF